MPTPSGQPLRILHAPRNIAGQAGDVVAALRRLGHHAELWEEHQEAFGRSCDRLIGNDLDAKAVWGLVEEAASRFDVVHFHFARTLVPRGLPELPPYWDLPVYRALGVRVFFTFHGSDIRIERVFREMNPYAATVPTPAGADDERVEQSIGVMRTYADRLFVTSMNYLEYVPDATYLPRVIDLATWPELPVEQRARPVIVHAPTRRARKGTDQVLADLDALAAEGLAFDLRLLEGVPHATVREELANADVLVDNIAAGAYGIVSLEAMACGKVTVANLSDAMAHAHPDAPTVNVTPDTFRDTMRRLIADPAQRTALALRGRPFVAAVHDADRVAERLVEAYRAPQEPVRPRQMPDWVAPGRTKQIAVLEGRIARLEADLARSRHHEAELREVLGLGPAGPSAARRIARAVLPHRWRARMLRLRR
ncbi:MAG: glycosyltransferase family 4 protein [Chloroflexota bacterium]